MKRIIFNLITRLTAFAHKKAWTADDDFAEGLWRRVYWLFEYIRKDICQCQ